MRTRGRRALVTVAALLGVAGFAAWFTLFRQASPSFGDDGEHFKYGSVGVEASSGLPYWAWYVMPAVCEGRPPGRAGYERFGFTFEEGHETPVGMPVGRVGFERIGINCALCHVGSVRTSATAGRQLLLGAPTSRFDLQGYLRFLFSCAESPRFDADTVLAEIGKVHPLPFNEALAYRYVVVPAMKRALAEQKSQMSWMERNPDWGPGRSDPFNPAKAQLLRLGPDGTIGNSDPPPLWNMKARRGLHWDGLNDSLHEIVLNSGIGNGASSRSIDLPGLARVEKWVTDLKPPAYPFAVDRDRAARGVRTYQAECASCHEPGAAQTGYAVPLAQLGTDPYRLASWGDKVADRFNGLGGYPWRYTRFRPTSGYVAVPLDGIWARAPYLHNGSVPDLADLLKAPAERPRTFYRGYDVYDPQRVGFVADGDEARAAGWALDTSLPGNANGGHRWGTDLPDEAKRDLLEYLKTL
jgi:hypothetical protein